MQHLRHEDYRTVPWKNGGGITREIALADDPAGGGFLWRLSMATVSASGPFSHFPGIDRTIACLKGNGMRLSFGDGGVTDVLKGGAPLAFPGEADIHADCIDGETIDLNVMTRRDRFGHAVDHVSSAAEYIVPPGTGTRAIFFAAPATVLTAEKTVEARRFDTVILTGETAPVTVSAETGLDIFAITLRPKGKSA